MKEIFTRMLQVLYQPDRFFEQVRAENSWAMPLVHLFLLSFLLSFGSVAAWAAGVPGDTPVNSSLGAQMDIYPYWKDTLLPQYGAWSYPFAAGLIMFEMWIITVIWVPVVFLVFRYLGGAKEPGGLLHAFQGFVYGLTPCLLGGFLPYLGAITGVWASFLQFSRGPATTLQNRTFVPYLFVSLFLGLAIARYWSHLLL